MRWAGHVARLGKRRCVVRVLGEKLDGKTPLERPRHRWKDNIKMDANEVGLRGMGWIDLAHYHLAAGHQWKVTETSVIERVCLFHVQGLPADRATLPFCQGRRFTLE
jgi:hypothetical protein